MKTKDVTNKSVIETIRNYLNHKNDYFIKDGKGNLFSIEDARLNNIVGTIVKDEGNKKKELYKYLFGKEKIDFRVLLQLDSAITQAIKYVWENFSFNSRANYNNDKRVIELLLKYGIKLKPLKQSKLNQEYIKKYPKKEVSYTSYIISILDTL